LDTSKVTTMKASEISTKKIQIIYFHKLSHYPNKLQGTFYDAISFNSDVSEWDVSKVTTFDDIFRGAENFNQNLCAWNLSCTANTNDMFTSSSCTYQSVNLTFRCQSCV